MDINLSRTSISRRNSKKVKKFVTAFPDGNISIPSDFLEPQPSTSKKVCTAHYWDHHNGVSVPENVSRLEIDHEFTISSQDDNYTVHSEDWNGNKVYSDDHERDIDNGNSDTTDNYIDESDSSSDDNRDGDSTCFDNNCTYFDPTNPYLSASLVSKRAVHEKDHLLSILAMSIRHHWTYEATLDVFKWTNNSHEASNLPTTKASLWKLLGRNSSLVTRYYYCSQCKEYLGEKSPTTNKLQKCCPCTRCGPKTNEKYIKYFLYLNLTAQIKSFLTLPGIAHLLEYRYWREKKDDNAIEDIYDGEQYKMLRSPGNILENRYNYSFTLNTDGCQVSNTGNTSAWPIYAEINELPPHVRKRHMFLVSIYVDDEHPIMNSFWKPLTDEMKKLSHEGIKWKPSSTVEVNSKFFVVTCSVDLPARAAVVNMKQYNGYNGCLYCYAPGKSLGPGRFVYPFDQSYGPLRNTNELKDDMRSAFESKQVVNGVKGLSALAALPEFDICNGVVVEGMHSVFLGAARQHTKLLFTSTNTPYYIGSKTNMSLINKRLLEIRPPSRRARKPISIMLYHHWKASEWRNWLDYAPVCLKRILPDKYLNHLVLLCEAIHYLNNEAITASELNRAENLLRNYVELFEKLFGQSSMSPNVHLLTHLTQITQTVLNWGPIWVHSAFVFESWNKKIIDCVTSSHARSDQIATRFLMLKFLLSAISDNTLSAETKKFIMKFIKIYPNDGVLREKIFGKGRSVSRTPTEEERLSLMQAGFAPTNVIFYKKIVVHGAEFGSENEKKTKYTNAYICYGDRLFGMFLTAVQFVHDNTIIRGIIVKKLKNVKYTFKTRCIFSAELSNELLFVEASVHVKPAIFMLTEGALYIKKLTNCWETD